MAQRGPELCLSISRLTRRLTAARRSRRETELLYPHHRPSSDLFGAAGAAGAVEPVVRAHSAGAAIANAGIRACIEL
jgi:hypothetical protein